MFQEGKSLMEEITLSEEQYYNDPPKLKERGYTSFKPRRYE
jgi:hypothetical protein